MGQSKQEIITESNFSEWLGSTGYIFPSNPLELSRFDKLYSDYVYKLSEECVDPFAIINGNFTPNKLNIRFEEEQDEVKSEDYKMAARNFDNIPIYILEKLKKNQNGFNSREKGISKEED